MKLPLLPLVAALLLAPAASSQISATLTGNCPGPMTLDVSGATPNAPLAIAYGFSNSTWTIPNGRCAGLVIDLVAPTLLTIINADPAGDLSLTRNAPAGVCTGYVIVVDVVSCTASSAVPFIAPPAVTFDFPSALSTVVGSVVGPTGTGGEYVGYFWDVNRGDMVSEQFAGPASISSYEIEIDVLNNLTITPVDWEVVINGTIVDTFQCLPGQFLLSETGNFAPIAGPNYSFQLRVTNTIPAGGGSNAFRFTGLGSHELTLQ